eukprot:4053586-Amphidinium_carterae.1
MKQDEITYGAKDRLVEVEVDEATLSRYGNGHKDKPLSWISYVGMVERGNPASLELIQLPVRPTVLRSPGPGPITKALWLPIARKAFTSGHKVVLHTDSARAYEADLPGVVHTSV